MKRYRLITNIWLDMRRNAFKSMPKATWGRLAEDEGLVENFGRAGIDAKVERFVELSPPWARPLWHKLSAEHEVYETYAFGAFYPALASACCLGEAILNELVARLAKYHKSTPEYKRIYNKEWLQDWPLMISTLESWGTMDPELVAKSTRLYELRNQSVHLRTLEEVDVKAREALTLYSDMIFALFGPSDQLIFSTPGEMYIRRDRESDPLVIEFFLDSCPYVGYKHAVEGNVDALKFVDDYGYENREISDEEFRILRIEWRE